MVPCEIDMEMLLQIERSHIINLGISDLRKITNPETIYLRQAVLLLYIIAKIIICLAVAN